MRLLDMHLKPEWSEVERVREQVLVCLGEHKQRRETCDAVAMTACELVENACKYGSYDAGEPGIEVQLESGRQGYTVSVSNPVDDAAADNLDRLDFMIQWIRGFQDPFEAYLERIKEISAEQLDSPESGLGLVRIAYEGQSILDFFLDDDSRITVSALHRV